MDEPKSDSEVDEELLCGLDNIISRGGIPFIISPSNYNDIFNRITNGAPVFYPMKHVNALPFIDYNPKSAAFFRDIAKDLKNIKLIVALTSFRKNKTPDITYLTFNASQLQNIRKLCLLYLKGAEHEHVLTMFDV